MAVWNIALIREQGISFAVALVKDSVLEFPSQRADAVTELSLRLGVPVVLLGERHYRTFGREDLVRWLRAYHPSQLPWRRMTLAA